jgi:hypothetical protein
MKAKSVFLTTILGGMLFATLAVPTVQAQTSKGGSFTVSADVVSSYIWRGNPQEGSKGGTPNIQPSITYTNGAFSIGTWGSSAFSGQVKEVDLFATLAMSNEFSFTVTDYNWNFNRNYFNYQSHETDHIYEATLAYAGVAQFPLSVSVNTMFFGADKNANGNNAYSTYVELNYPLASNVKAFLGASLVDSPMVYGNSNFALINIGLKATKIVKFTDTFSLPVYGILGCNPHSGKAFLVAGITL